jgi:hypothetical protein
VASPAPSTGGSDPKGALLAAIREHNKTLYSMVVAQAQQITIEGRAIIFTFAPAHRSLKAQLERQRSTVEQLAQTVLGQKLSVITRDGQATAAPETSADASAAAARKAALEARAKAEPTVQAVLDVFGGEIEDVEEIK